MTKFEEEVKRPVIGIGQSSIKPALGKAVEFYTDKVKEYHNAFSDMNKYIDVIENALEKKDEEIADLKSQLQQQALPVVPEFVDKFLKSKPIFNIVKYPIPIEIITWANKQTGYMDLEINITYLVKLKANGYKVEKPQLFYLKSKSLLEGENDYEEPDLDELYLNANGNLVIYNYEAKKFTQQEIDSMQTGSYEQIEVTE